MPLQQRSMLDEHDATIDELLKEWDRVIEYWDKINKDNGMLDYPWTRARFNLEVFKTMLNQRGWNVPVMLGGPLR